MINIGKRFKRANIHIIGVFRQEKQNNKIQKIELKETFLK